MVSKMKYSIQTRGWHISLCRFPRISLGSRPGLHLFANLGLSFIQIIEYIRIYGMWGKMDHRSKKIETRDEAFVNFYQRPIFSNNLDFRLRNVMKFFWEDYNRNRHHLEGAGPFYPRGHFTPNHPCIHLTQTELPHSL